MSKTIQLFVSITTGLTLLITLIFFLPFFPTPTKAASIAFNDPNEMGQTINSIIFNRPANTTCLNNVTVTSTADNGLGSLRHAIENICSGQTIDFAPSLTNQTITLTSGELNITKTITITNPNAANLQISGNNTHRVFSIQAGISVTITNLSVISGAAGSNNGGGINNAGALLLSNVTVRDNSSMFGGGIYNSGMLTIINSSFIENQGVQLGGALHNESGDVMLTNVNILTNSAAVGGGVFNYEGTITVLNGLIKGNVATFAGGGGLFSQQNEVMNTSLMILDNTEVISNSAKGAGGGIYNRGILNVTNSIISRNVADENGAGIYNTNYLANATLRNSEVTTNTSDSRGGGITNERDADMSVEHSIIRNNQAGSGGGFYLIGPSFITVTHTTIISNRSNSGGGIHNSSSGIAIFDHSFISKNTSTGVGGGIRVGASVATTILSFSTVSHNQSVGSGGGLYANGQLALTNTLVISNVSDESGGGVHKVGACTWMNMENSTISHNEAKGTFAFGGGGGLFLDARATLRNSTISHNLSNNNGGGVHVSFTGTSNCEGTLVLTNTTISSNSAKDGGGVFNRSFTKTALNNSTVTANSATGLGGGFHKENSGVVNLKNSLVAGNIAPTGPECGATLNSEDYNLIQDLSGCTVSGDTTHNVINQAPLLGPLQNNGGSTLTHALLQGSPAINAANNATCTNEDQRGLPRPAFGQCDIGAFELIHITYLPIVMKL